MLGRGGGAEALRARQQRVGEVVLAAASEQPGVAAALSQYLATLMPVEHEVRC